MILEATGFAGLHVIRAERQSDERGFVARLWSADDFATAGIAFVPSQIVASFNRLAGTLRGLHWQSAPHAETKLVRATQGRVWDVVVDLRLDSPTRYRSFAMELDADDHTSLLIPKDFAHGFMTLCDAAEVQYCMDSRYVAGAACGARYDDPALAIAWPREPSVITQKDLRWPPLLR